MPAVSVTAQPEAATQPTPDLAPARLLGPPASDYLRDPETGQGWTSVTFDLARWMAWHGGQPALPPVNDSYTLEQRTKDMAELLATSEGRRALCQHDPLMFGIVYCRSSISMDGLPFGPASGMTFSDGILGMLRWAHTWPVNPPASWSIGWRDAFAEPRDSGKSTWLCKVLPLWMACYGRVRFMVLIGAVISNIQDHFDWWELALQSHLAADFPEFCHARTVRSNGRFQLIGRHFTMYAGSVRRQWRGTVSPRNERPDLIVLDDIEPDLASPDRMENILDWLLRTVLPMNRRARVVLANTATKYGSVMDEILRDVRDQSGSSPPWVHAARWQAHYTPPIITDPVTGEERSHWPGRWPLEGEGGLLEQRASGLAKEWHSEQVNKPVAGAGGRWTTELLTACRVDAFQAVEAILFIDPAMKKGAKNDQTALTVAARGCRSTTDRRSAVAIYSGLRVRQIGADLRATVNTMIATSPVPISRVVVESNQGGEWWHDNLRDLPVPLETLHVPSNQGAKDQRIILGSSHYIQGRVVHVGRQLVEDDMLAYDGEGSLPHDDLIDVTTFAAHYWWSPHTVGRKTGKPAPRAHTGQIPGRRIA